MLNDQLVGLCGRGDSMVELYTDWQCPNCGKTEHLALFDNRTCSRCGWSEEMPEDTNRGYE